MTVPAAIGALVTAALDEADTVVVVVAPGASLASSGLVWANGAAGRLLGFDPMVEPARAVAALFGGASAAFSDALAGRAGNTDLPVRNAGGAARILGARLMPANDIDGPTQVVLLGRDISDRRRQSAAELSARLLLVQAFAAAAVAVFVATADGRLALVNPQLTQLLGHPIGALNGAETVTIIHPGDRGAWVTAIAAQDRDGKPFATALRLVRSDGEHVLARLEARVAERAETGRVRVCTVLPDQPAATPARSGPLMLATRLEVAGLANADGAATADAFARVEAAAEEVFGRRTAPPDSWSKTGVGRYLLCLGGDSEDAIAFRATTIADEVRRQIQGMSDRLGAVDVVTDLRPLAAGEAGASELLARQLEDRLAGLRQARATTARETLATTLGALRCVASPVLAQGGRETGMRFIDLERQAWQRIAVAAAALPAEETEALRSTPLRLGLAAPLLDAATQPQAWLLPVGFEDFEQRSRAAQLMETLRGLVPQPPGRLIPVLTELTANAGNRRIGDLLRQLRGLGQGAGVTVSSLEALPFDLLDRVATLVVIDAPMLLEALARRPKVTAQSIARLADHGAKVLARGAVGPEQVATLLKGGADFIVADDA